MEPTRTTKRIPTTPKISGECDEAAGGVSNTALNKGESLNKASPGSSPSPASRCLQSGIPQTREVIETGRLPSRIPSICGLPLPTVTGNGTTAASLTSTHQGSSFSKPALSPKPTNTSHVGSSDSGDPRVTISASFVSRLPRPSSSTGGQASPKSAPGIPKQAHTAEPATRKAVTPPTPGRTASSLNSGRSLNAGNKISMNKEPRIATEASSVSVVPMQCSLASHKSRSRLPTSVATSSTQPEQSVNSISSLIRSSPSHSSSAVTQGREVVDAQAGAVSVLDRAESALVGAGRVGEEQQAGSTMKNVASMPIEGLESEMWADDEAGGDGQMVEGEQQREEKQEEVVLIQEGRAPCPDTMPKLTLRTASRPEPSPLTPEAHTPGMPGAPRCLPSRKQVSFTHKISDVIVLERLLEPGKAEGCGDPTTHSDKTEPSYAEPSYAEPIITSDPNATTDPTASCVASTSILPQTSITTNSADTCPTATSHPATDLAKITGSRNIATTSHPSAGLVKAHRLTHEGDGAEVLASESEVDQKLARAGSHPLMLGSYEEDDDLDVRPNMFMQTEDMAAIQEAALMSAAVDPDFDLVAELAGKDSEPVAQEVQKDCESVAEQVELQTLHEDASQAQQEPEPAEESEQAELSEGMDRVGRKLELSLSDQLLPSVFEPCLVTMDFDDCLLTADFSQAQQVPEPATVSEQSQQNSNEADFAVPADSSAPAESAPATDLSAITGVTGMGISLQPKSTVTLSGGTSHVLSHVSLPDFDPCMATTDFGECLITGDFSPDQFQGQCPGLLHTAQPNTAAVLAVETLTTAVGLGDNHQVCDGDASSAGEESGVASVVQLRSMNSLTCHSHIITIIEDPENGASLLEEGAYMIENGGSLIDMHADSVDAPSGFLVEDCAELADTAGHAELAEDDGVCTANRVSVTMLPEGCAGLGCAGLSEAEGNVALSEGEDGFNDSRDSVTTLAEVPSVNEPVEYFDLNSFSIQQSANMLETVAVDELQSEVRQADKKPLPVMVNAAALMEKYGPRSHHVVIASEPHEMSKSADLTPLLDASKALLLAAQEWAAAESAASLALESVDVSATKSGAVSVDESAGPAAEPAPPAAAPPPAAESASESAAEPAGAAGVIVSEKSVLSDECVGAWALEKADSRVMSEREVERASARDEEGRSVADLSALLMLTKDLLDVTQVWAQQDEPSPDRESMDGFGDMDAQEAIDNKAANLGSVPRADDEGSAILSAEEADEWNDIEEGPEAEQEEDVFSDAHGGSEGDDDDSASEDGRDRWLDGEDERYEEEEDDADMEVILHAGGLELKVGVAGVTVAALDASWGGDSEKADAKVQATPEVDSVGGAMMPLGDADTALMAASNPEGVVTPQGEAGSGMVPLSNVSAAMLQLARNGSAIVRSTSINSITTPSSARSAREVYWSQFLQGPAGQQEAAAEQVLEVDEKLDDSDADSVDLDDDDAELMLETQGDRLPDWDAEEGAESLGDFDSDMQLDGGMAVSMDDGWEGEEAMAEGAMSKAESEAEFEMQHEFAKMLADTVSGQELMAAVGRWQAAGVTVAADQTHGEAASAVSASFSEMNATGVEGVCGLGKDVLKASVLLGDSTVAGHVMHAGKHVVANEAGSEDSPRIGAMYAEDECCSPAQS